ncbi:hypothetical protein AO377_1519 [Moraxella catarrhalis]|nr:hypothetical protein AO377_1519 [Moraxella catarrhalis]OAV12757.1 hypothetical protein AO375_1731 [Moraxella catarrhalis]OAV38275.1 hypothetical protein AO365_0119 [Moraxella catarrhalis]
MRKEQASMMIFRIKTYEIFSILYRLIQRGYRWSTLAAKTSPAF